MEGGRFSQARVEKSLDMLIRQIGRENSGLGRPAECLSGNVSTSPPAQGSVPDPQEDKASNFTDGTLSDFTDDTLTNNSDCPSGGGAGVRGGGGGGGSPPSPVISEGGSFSSGASGQGHVYQRVKAEDTSVQINGDMLSTLSSFRTPNNYYMDVTASGKSWQINGNLDLEPFLELVKAR